MQDFGNSTPQEKEKYRSYKGNERIKFMGMANPIDAQWGLDLYAPSELELHDTSAL